MRYTDGKDQCGTKLPAPVDGDIATDRVTGESFSFKNGKWLKVADSMISNKPAVHCSKIDALIK